MQLWFRVCCRQWHANTVLSFSELVTQIQKMSQAWMIALNVRDTVFMERAYFYMQGFHFWNVTKQNLRLPGGEFRALLTDLHGTVSVHP